MRAIWYALPLLLAGGCSSITDADDEFRAAQRAAERWVGRHPQEWTLSLSGDRALAPAPWSRPCSQNPPGGLLALRFEAEGAEADLFFRCPVSAPVGARELEAAFSHVALTRLPHGIRSPGWEFRVLTPSSSFGDGVTFDRTAAGRLLVRINAPLFAVEGRSTRAQCQPPADGPLAEGCYLVREHRIPLRLGLSAGVSDAAIR